MPEIFSFDLRPIKKAFFACEAWCAHKVVIIQDTGWPLFLSFHKREEIKAAQTANFAFNFLYIDTTIQLVQFVRNHVVIHVQPPIFIAPSRIHISRLPRVDWYDITTLGSHNEKWNERDQLFSIPITTFATGSGAHSFNGVVN